MKRNHKRYLRSGDLRFAVCCVVLTLLFLPLRRACAQDALPGCPRLQETAFDCDTLMVCRQRTDTLFSCIPVSDKNDVFIQIRQTANKP